MGKKKFTSQTDLKIAVIGDEVRLTVDCVNLQNRIPSLDFVSPEWVIEMGLEVQIISSWIRVRSLFHNS
jgi:hypothetical protein